MSAAELRKAAETLRELAVAAVDGPWEAREGNVEHFFPKIGQHGAVATGEDGSLPYIATMHPGVGLALADWLEAAALTWGHLKDSGVYLVRMNALALARLINGGAA